MVGNQTDYEKLLTTARGLVLLTSPERSCRLGNVDPGIDDNDCVNFKQLKQYAGGITVQDHNSPLTTRAFLNFLGAGVTVTDDPSNNRINITIGSGSSGNGNSLRDTVIVGNSFQPLTAVRFNSGNFVNAQANNAANAEGVGIVESSTGSQFVVVYSGIINFSTPTLTPDAVYFLSDATPGILTTTEPTTNGSVSKPLLVARTSTQGLVVNFRGDIIGSSSGPLNYSGATPPDTTNNLSQGFTKFSLGITDNGSLYFCSYSDMSTATWNLAYGS